jgi:YVTN family beta-propeller protein
MRRRALVVLFVAAALAPAAGQPARTRYIPEGSPVSLGLAGYAKVLCSAVFVSGRDEREAARNSGYFMMPPELEDKPQWTVDRAAKTVRMTLDGVTREAKYYGDQGCIIHHQDDPRIHFTPVPVRTALPDAASQPWPMGDAPDARPLPPEIDRAKLDAAVDAAFADPAALTAGFIVVHKGRIVAERYGPGITKDTQLESWSMGKSITSTLFALLVKDGTYTLEGPAPVPAWRQPGDPRAAIRNIDLLRMSSGLRFIASQDPDYTPDKGYPDHFYIYTGAVDAFEYSMNKPLQYPVNTVGRYRNSDPLTIGYLVKQAVQARGEEYLTWPQRALFDRIGIRRQLLETDPYGNFLLTGYDYGTPRNWARLGMLYLQDGVWQGQRLLPEGWTRFVSTPAPAWERPVYGGLFWINGDGAWNIPKDAYFMAGAGGQNTFIIPSHDLVVVRMGHFRGAPAGRKTLNAAFTHLMQAIPPAGRGSEDPRPQEDRSRDSTLWVTLGDIDQLVEVDPYAFRELRRVTVDPKPHGLAASADGSRIYLASDRTGNFQVVDARSGRVVEQIHLGNDPNQMTLTRDGRFAYVPMRGEDAVAIVQLDPLKVVRKIPMDKGPHDAYTGAGGRRIFVGAQFGRSIGVFDPDSGSLVQQIPTDDGVRPMQPSKDGRLLYAALSNLLGFVVVDPWKGVVTKRVELGTLPEGVPEPYLETWTHALQLVNGGEELWVTDCINDLVRIVRTSDLKEIAQVRVGRFPHWFTQRPDGRVVFVSLWDSHAVAAIDVKTRKVLANIQFPRGSGPKRILVAPNPEPRT